MGWEGSGMDQKGKLGEEGQDNERQGMARKLSEGQRMVKKKRWRYLFVPAVQGGQDTLPTIPHAAINPLGPLKFSTHPLVEITKG